MAVSERLYVRCVCGNDSMTDMQPQRDSIFDHIIFFDMDNVLIDFKSGLERVSPYLKAQYAADETGRTGDNKYCIISYSSFL